VAVAEFEEQAPDIIVMAFKTLEQAERYYLALHRFGQTIYRRPHRTILLCRKEDAVAAFELCKKRYFDDYVLYWPNPQDGLRIPMSVWIAAREIQALQQEGPTGPELRANARHLVTGGANGAIEIKDSAALARELAQFKKHQIDCARTARDQGLGPLKSWAKDLKDKVAPALARTGALATQVQQHQPTLLVIDDDEAMRFALEPVLSSLAHVQPDAVLMDIRLSDTDGINLTRQLRSIPQLAQVPVVLMSGDSRRDTLLSGIEAGATDFMAKPFTREVLRTKLDKVLRRGD
jgi:CheY-like chemotaxis protein